jgi:hypothetical protein
LLQSAYHRASALALFDQFATGMLANYKAELVALQSAKPGLYLSRTPLSRASAQTRYGQAFALVQNDAWTGMNRTPG